MLETRLETYCREAKSKGRKLLIPYLVAGDPNLDVCLDLMHALVEAGADIIELGVPFSDPSSDGPVIQLGAERAIAAGVTLDSVFELARKFRERNQRTPVVLMGYLNPIERIGYENFAAKTAAAQIDGVLVVDLPPAESGDFPAQLRSNGANSIYLVAPTTSDQRAKEICQACSGYLYYVSLKGVTGAAISDPQAIRENVGKIRALTDLPIVIGFGIKDGDSAAKMAAIADGVVIGSALVERIREVGERLEADHDNGQYAAHIADSVAIIAEIRRALDG